MSLETASLRAIALAGVAALALAAGATLVLRPETDARDPEPAFVSAPPRPVSPAAVRPAAELGEAFIAISEAVTPAVVRIEAERGRRPGGVPERRLDRLFDAPPEEGQPEGPAELELSGGSGFVVSPDGYILTNHHVIDGASRITVALADKRTFTATVVGSDPFTDVAVIRIGAAGLPAVPLGDSDSTRVGEWVLAIGNPGFEGASTLDFTVTGGIISAKGRGLEVLAAEEPAATPQGSLVIEDFIQTDAVINPGNSGGPLVNLRGAVIGINTAIASTTGSYQGYGFAIPANLVRRVMRDLVDYGFMRRPLLGVSIIDVSAEDAEVYGLPRIAGVLVEDFSPGSAAEHAGVRRHDVIVSVDGQPVDRLGQLQQLVARHDPGDEVVLGVIRFGRLLEHRVTLREAPHLPVSRSARPATAESIGLEVAELDAALARRLGYDVVGGAVISAVTPGSAAFYRSVAPGLRIRTIDRHPVNSAREARRLLHAARPGSVLSLLLEDTARRTYIVNLRVP